MLLTSGCRQLLSTNSYGVSTEADAGCELAEPAKPPSELNVPGAKPELTFAVRRIDVGDGSLKDGGLTAGEIGYDIDGVCSSPKNPGRCRNSGSAVTDGPGGRDNALGALVASIPSFAPIFPLNVQIMNEQVEQGRTPPQGIFRVRDYGGDRNDDAVTVDWLLPSLLPNAADANANADQFSSAGEGGGAGAGSVDFVVPTWSTDDHWPIFSDTFVRAAGTSCDPLSDAQLGQTQQRTSLSAYVTDQHLVAHFPDGLPIRFWIFEAPLIDAVMTADLVFNYDTRSFEMHNGVISGLAPSWALLHDIPPLQALLGIPAECRSNSLYPATKKFVCSTADWSCASGPNASCDWASVGIAFDTAPASVGEMLPEPKVVEACPGLDDPGTDSCTN